MPFVRFRVALALALALACVAAGCTPAPVPSGSPSPTPATAPSPAQNPARSPSASGGADGPRELIAGSGPLVPGTYTHTGFRPPLTFAVEDGWVPGTVTSGFMDVQQDPGTPDVIAVQFAQVDRVVGAGRSATPATTVDAVVRAIHANPGLVVIDESASRLGGLEGLNVTVENQNATHSPIMDVSAGRLGIDPKRRLWISLFETPDGVLAVMVGGSAATWDHALAVAEPVLESVAVGEPAASPAAAASVRIAFDGQGPLGLDIDGDSAWVVLSDSGDLVEVDLSTHEIVRSTPIGSGGQQVIVADDGTIYVGRYATDAAGQHILEIDPSSGTTIGIAIGPIGGLALDGRALWALQKTGEVALIDAGERQVTSSVTVQVDQDAHMDAVAGDGSVWVSGDRTPVRRISAPESTIEADIVTGGGIPLDDAGGLVWGARPDQLWAIDPSSDSVTRTVALENVDEILALDIDVEADEAWIAVRRPGRVGAVIAVDLTSGDVIAESAVSLPAAVRLTPDRAWVTDYETNQLIGLARP